MKLNSLLCALTLICLVQYSIAQQQIHETSADYDKPDDPLVRENLDQWQDLKFGLFMHWGTYSQWGVIESWTLCPEDWIERKPEHGETYFDYVKNYENLQRTFNPRSFNPQKWADAAKAAGMKYMVFTTKHHDGFAMYDTKESDYKITSVHTPFSVNPKADVTKEIFNTFRHDGFKIGAYFSKPDWHSDYYWWKYFPPKDRNVNYEIKKYPERWEKFKDFTYNQLNELTSNYGKVDILWLDGGQVRPSETNNQDIDMERIGTMVRKNQPGILVVDRTVPGKWENYVTPEQAIPDRPLNKPWESCITMGDFFSYVPNDKYKSSKTIIETLVRIISRGGNYLLNIAPEPNGDFDQVAYERLNDIAAWMKINESAVFATRTVAPYHEGDYYYTQSKDNKTINIFHLSDGEIYQQPAVYVFEVPENFKVAKLNILGYEGKLNWRQQDNKITVKSPQFKFDYATAIQLQSK